MTMQGPAGGIWMDSCSWMDHLLLCWCDESHVWLLYMNMYMYCCRVAAVVKQACIHKFGAPLQMELGADLCKAQGPSQALVAAARSCAELVPSLVFAGYGTQSLV
jgi:hypothetical protein